MGLAQPPRRRDPLSSEPTGIVGREKNGDPRDVVRLSQASERRIRHHLSFEVAPDDPAAVNAFGFHAARSELAVASDLDQSRRFQLLDVVR